MPAALLRIDCRRSGVAPERPFKGIIVVIWAKQNSGSDLSCN